MKVLFLGDIVGKPGRAAVRHFVPLLRERHRLDLCVGNSETGPNKRRSVQTVMKVEQASTAALKR